MAVNEDRQTAAATDRQVKLVPEGVEIGGRTVPLLAGSVHYWRLDPNEWRACLLAVKKLGLHFVDTYVPWGVHEVSPGKLELGETDPQRDVAKFCRLAEEVGLYVILRPGPHINAELTYFGLPKRIVWDGACQARSPEQNPVMLPMLPLAFPVPSYASDAFHDEVARYFQLLGPALARLSIQTGPSRSCRSTTKAPTTFAKARMTRIIIPMRSELFATFCAPSMEPSTRSSSLTA